MGHRLSRKAEEDVIEIFVHGVEQFGLAQAETYHDLLASTFSFLADNPRAGRLREELDPPVRIHPVQAHLVVYRLEEDGDVFIIRVRHGHEDWSVEDG